MVTIRQLKDRKDGGGKTLQVVHFCIKKRTGTRDELFEIMLRV
jgi:hypothetical protein